MVATVADDVQNKRTTEKCKFEKRDRIKAACKMTRTKVYATDMMHVQHLDAHIKIVTLGEVNVSQVHQCTFQPSTSYIERLDVYEPAQTVREALRIFVDLRQPFDIPREVRVR